MSTKREEEKNEKIIRGLLKLPPNRRCINCNSLGPQYVCTNFWTFVCMTCSGIHREFTHRVKSVSMAKFTKQEVEALQNGGNQRARELFMKDWDIQQMRLPDSSNVGKIREFIKDVYVNKKYAQGKLSNKQPSDVESLSYHEDPRRASSYHSFSQSPPYDYQYEDRRYGKQFGMLTRNQGSDRGQYQGKLTSVIYSPGRLHGQIYEDRFANESSGSRMSDFSVSSAGDQFRYDSQSPSSQDAGYGSPHSYQSKDILVEDVRPHILNRHNEAHFRNDCNNIPHPKRSTSSGSFTSFGSKSFSNRPVDAVGRRDVISETAHSKFSHKAGSSTALSIEPSAPSHVSQEDVFKLHTTQQSKVYTPPIDLFAGFSNEPSSTNLFDKKSPAIPFSQSSSTNFFIEKTSSVPTPLNEGWATFDIPKENPATSAAVVPSVVTDNWNVSGLLPNQSGVVAMSNHGTSATVHPDIVEPDGSLGRLVPQQSAFDATVNKGTSSAVLPGTLAHEGTDGGLTPHQSGFEVLAGQGTSETMIPGDLTHKGSLGGLVPHQSGFDTLLFPGIVAHNRLVPHQSSFDTAANEGTYPAVLPGDMVHKGDVGGFMLNMFGFFPTQNVGQDGTSPQVHGQWHADLHEDNRSVHQKISQSVHSWNAFDDSSGNATHAPTVSQFQNSVTKFPEPEPAFHEKYKISDESFLGSVLNATTAGSTLSFDAATGVSSFSASLHPLVGAPTLVQKSTNPFDLSDDSDSTTTSSFFDMSSLHSALPSSQSHNDNLAGLSQAWFPQSSISDFHPISEGAGGLQYMAGQGPASQLPNLPPQGHITYSFGGNPFT